MSGQRVPPLFVTMSSIIPAVGLWSKNCLASTSAASWEVTFTLATIAIRDGINDALVHYLRDVHDLKEKYPHDEHLFAWARAVKAIYDEAVAWVEKNSEPTTSPRQQKLARVAQQHADRGGNYGRSVLPM